MRHKLKISFNDFLKPFCGNENTNIIQIINSMDFFWMTIFLLVRRSIEGCKAVTTTQYGNQMICP